MRYLVVLSLLLSLGLAGGAAAQTAAADAPPLAADTALTTGRGTTFTAPAGWRVTGSGGHIVLSPPEGDSKLALLEVRAADADAAVAAGWASFRPEGRRPIRLTLPQTAFNGWDERRLFNYQISPNERVVVYALAWRAGADWLVAIVEAGQATFQKRNAGFSLAIGSLRPKGYQRELFSGRTAHRLDRERIALITGFIADVMRDFGIPGVGLSLIDGGRVVWEGGLGVRALGSPEPVDADTLFVAASNTKAMTTLLLAELADEGRLRWDQPVTELYPSFRLADDETTRQVLVKHLLCACTGMPRQDMEWLFNFGAATPQSSLAALAQMRPTTRFGEAYQYSNPMAGAAGYIGAALLNPGAEPGAAYDAAMRAKVFAPLGMTRTTFDFAAATASGNFASPHGDDVDGGTMPARMDNNLSIVPLRPAGGMWTSARELARYLELELAEGVLANGTRLVSRENLLERRKPQAQMGEDTTYGMGLVVDRLYGIPVLRHGGSLFGYKSDMIFLPDHGVGAVVLTNADTGGFLTGFVRRRLLEVLFDGKPQAEELARVALVQRKANIAKSREGLKVPADAGEAGKLARRYHSPALGTLAVRSDNGATIFDFGSWHTKVASRRNYDKTTSFVTIDPTITGFAFVAGEREGRRALIIRDAQHEYAFIEQPAP